MATKATIRQMRYDKTHTKTYCIKMNLVNDADIIEKLSSVPSMQGYIKQLIRQDLAGSVPVLPVAKWVKKSGDCLYCSNCNMPSMNRQNYCCGCGAKMEQSSDSVPEKQTGSVPDSAPIPFRDPYADPIAKAVGTWIDAATSVLSDEKPYIVADSVPENESDK